MLNKRLGEAVRERVEMAKIKQSPKLPAEQRREQLLEAARKLFVEKGYRGTSTEEIARKASLTKGALYFHFESKEDILLGLVKMLSAQFQASLESLPVPLTPWQIVEAQVGCLDITGPRDFRSIMDIWVQAQSVPKIRKFIQDANRERAKYVCSHLDPSLKLNKTELQQLVYMTFALCDGLAARRVFDKGAIDVACQVKLFQSMLGCLQKRENHSIRGKAR